MNSKSLINSRFLEVVDFLINDNKSLKSNSKGSIADRMNVSKSKFSEILNGRMSIGLEDLAKFCSEFDINPSYILLGQGNISIVFDENRDAQPYIAAEPVSEYKVSVDEMLDLQREMIQTQRSLILEYQEKLGKEKATKMA